MVQSHFNRIKLFLFLVLSSSFSLAQSSRGVSLQLKIQDPSGTFPTQAGTAVNLKVISPNGCILLEEQYSSVNIQTGYLKLTVGSGTRTGADKNYSLQNTFSNLTVKNNVSCMDSSGNIITTAGTYTPLALDARTVRVTFTVAGQPLVADFSAQSSPYAIESESFSGALAGDVTGSQLSTTVQKIQGKNISSLSPTDGQVLSWNSVNNNWEPKTVSSGGGSPTSITGAVPINTTSPISTTADISGQNLIGNSVSTKNIYLYTADNSASVSLLAPSSISSSYSLKFPTAQGGANQYLVNDGTGQLSWGNSPAAPVTSVAGRTGAVTLTNADISGLGAAALLNVGTAVGTVAAGNDSRFTDGRAHV